jgi:hypothetical protein
VPGPYHTSDNIETYNLRGVPEVSRDIFCSSKMHKNMSIPQNIKYITKYGLGIDTLAALSYISFAQKGI